MDTTLLWQEQKQRILVGVFAAILVVGLGVVWYGFLRTPVVPSGTAQPPLPRVGELDFQVFSDPAFLELGVPPRKIPVPSEVGRGNPFLAQ